MRTLIAALVLSLAICALGDIYLHNPRGSHNRNRGNGVNVENASFGLSLCAERAAVANAVTAGATEFIAIAIAGPHDDIPCPPCGACRQVLHEFSPGLQIVTSHGARTPRITPLTELLPAAFDQRALRREPDS